MKKAVAFGIWIFVLLLVAGLTWWFVWKPLEEQKTALEAETQRLNNEAGTLQTQLATLRDIREHELDYRADLDRIRSMIPAFHPEQPSFVRSFQLSADASGVAVVGVSFGRPTMVDGANPDSEGLVLAQVPVDMTVTGSYFKLADFYRRLEIDVIRATQVDGVTISEIGDETTYLESEWTGRIFTLLPLAEVDQPASPPPAESGTDENAAADGVEAATTPPNVEGES